MIEDDEEFAEILSEYLAKYNIKITNYADPYLGLSAGIKKYDLLILDLTLPGMDGLEVCKEVVAKYDIPIIISSGAPQPEGPQGSSASVSEPVIWDETEERPKEKPHQIATAGLSMIS